NVWFGFGKPATGPISSNFAITSLYTPEVKSYNVPNGVEIAGRLLDEAGLKRGPDGVRLAIVHDLTPYGEQGPRSGEYVQQVVGGAWPIAWVQQLHFVTGYNKQFKDVIVSPLGLYTAFDRAYLDK